VADDDPDGVETLAILLRAAGHEVRVAFDGPTTLEVANDFRPQVVFLDLGMPGMDGYQIARELRQMDGLEKTLLVALTGYGRESDRERAHDAGFDVFLVKPTPPKLLCEIAMQARR
jgi:CheY-like chemotaxis protein